MTNLNDVNSNSSEFQEKSDDSALAKKLQGDANAIDGSVSNELQQKLFSRISEVEKTNASENSNVSESSNTFKSKVIAFPFKRFVMPTAIAASFFAVLMLANLNSLESNGALQSVAKVESQTSKTNQSEAAQMPSSAIGSKHLNKEMVAIKADFDKLKQRIASL